MQTRERGAAHINIYFFLVLLVVFLGTLWFGYLQMTKVHTANEGEKKALAAEKAALRSRKQLEQYAVAITAVIGHKGTFTGETGYKWIDRFDKKVPTPLEAYSDPKIVKQKLEDLAVKLGFAKSQVNPIGPFLGQIEALKSSLDAKVAKADGDLKTAQMTLAAEQGARRTSDQKMTAALNTERSTYTKNTTDRDNEITRGKARLGDANTKISELGDEKDKMREDHATAVTKLNKRHDRDQGQLSAYASRMAQINPPDQTDGGIITASMKAGRAWINIGRKDMLLRGTKFRITNPSGKKIKGYGEVMTTLQDRSELRLYDVADAVGHPITHGDQIFNALYSPHLKRSIAMIGRFSFPYTKPVIKKLLERLGNTVYDEVKVGVDMVIVGLRDPTESGEGLKPIEDTKGYKKAQTLHCEIITIQKIRDLLKLGE